MPPTDQLQSSATSEQSLGDVIDPVIEAYKKDVDRTLLRENLKLTPAQRIEKFVRAMKLVFELRRTSRVRRGLAP